MRNERLRFFLLMVFFFLEDRKQEKIEKKRFC